MRVDDGVDEEVYWFHTDHLGSTSLMSNISGTVVPSSTVRYLPFGEPRIGEVGQLPSDHGFTGHRHNDNVGLIFMRARYYLPEIGRFASADTIVPDPLFPQMMNRYSYAGGNPIGFTDSTGHYLDRGGGGFGGAPPV